MCRAVLGLEVATNKPVRTSSIHTFYLIFILIFIPVPGMMTAMTYYYLLSTLCATVCSTIKWSLLLSHLMTEQQHTVPQLYAKLQNINNMTMPILQTKARLGQVPTPSLAHESKCSPITGPNSNHISPKRSPRGPKRSQPGHLRLL